MLKKGQPLHDLHCQDQLCLSSDKVELSTPWSSFCIAGVMFTPLLAYFTTIIHLMAVPTTAVLATAR